MHKAGLNITTYDPKQVVIPEGINRAQTASEAATGADMVIALTAGDDALGALDQADTDIPTAALYADFSTNSASASVKSAQPLTESVALNRWATLAGIKK